ERGFDLAHQQRASPGVGGEHGEPAHPGPERAAHRDPRALPGRCGADNALEILAAEARTQEFQPQVVLANMDDLGRHYKIRGGVELHLDLLPWLQREIFRLFEANATERQVEGV